MEFLARGFSLPWPKPLGPLGSKSAPHGPSHCAFQMINDKISTTLGRSGVGPRKVPLRPLFRSRLPFAGELGQEVGLSKVDAGPRHPGLHPAKEKVCLQIRLFPTPVTRDMNPAACSRLPWNSHFSLVGNLN